MRTTFTVVCKFKLQQKVKPKNCYVPHCNSPTVDFKCLQFSLSTWETYSRNLCINHTRGNICGTVVQGTAQKVRSLIPRMVPGNVLTHSSACFQ